MFDSIATLAVASNMRCAEYTTEDLAEISHQSFSVQGVVQVGTADTPLAPYFSECISSEDLDEMNVEIMRNIFCTRSVSFLSDTMRLVVEMMLTTLLFPPNFQAYLSDFLKFCESSGSYGVSHEGEKLRP